MKKKLLTLLLTLCAAFAIIGFVGCDNEQPHTHAYTAQITAPTCTTEGYTTYTCDCGTNYRGDYVNATGHIYAEQVTAPTCENAGYTTYTCVCGDSYEDSYVNATGHTYTIQGTLPTCTEDGDAVYTCDCGYSYEDRRQAFGHSFTNYVSDNDTLGIETAVCDRPNCNATDTQTDVVYTLSADGTYYEVTGLAHSNKTEIYILSEYNGLPVTTIGGSALRNCYNLKNVTIGDNVTTIGGAAFLLCRSLTSVTIGDSVTTIAWEAFAGCSNLTSIDIPNSVTEISGYAFGGCSNLTSIDIPNSVTSIGPSAFTGCSNLTNVTFEDTSTWYYGGIEISVANPSDNATYFKSTYVDNYWYKI